MSPPGSGHEGPDRPIRVLRDHEHETGPDFMARVRRKIDRRTTAGQFASYTWHLPKTVVFELTGILGFLFSSISGKRDSSS